MASVPKKQVIGIVGGIGSGKSLVAKILQEFDGALINADRLGHEALRQPEIKSKLIQRWGGRIQDVESGEVDRREVAKIVFADDKEREFLQQAVFPYIEAQIRHAIDHANADSQASFIILDAAIMMESGWDRVCDKIIFVHTAKSVRQERLADTRNWTTKEVTQRKKAQLPLVEKVTRADYVVDNSGSEAELRRRIRTLIPKLGLTQTPMCV